MQLNFVLTIVNAAVIDSAMKYRLYICYKKNISLDSNQNQKLFYIKWAFQILQINISHNTVKNATDILSKLEWIYIELQMALTTKHNMSQYFMVAMAAWIIHVMCTISKRYYHIKRSK